LTATAGVEPAGRADAVLSVSPARRRTRLWLVALVCGIVASVHSLAYVFATPPWAIEDEEQHVDYVLSLRDHGHIPRVDETIRPSIVASTIDTRRWESLGLGVTFLERDPAKRGLEGLSYEGYQPPLYYLLLVPVVAPLGDRPLAAMYAGRLVGALCAGLGAAFAALLAARWARGVRPAHAALLAGLFLGAIPVYAEAMARVNNDTGLAVTVVGSLLLMARFVERPDSWRALAIGACLGAAVAMKVSALVAIAPAAVALLSARRTCPRRVSLTHVTAIAAPPAVVAVWWMLVTRERYGVLNPVTGFVARIGRFPSLGMTTLARDALRLTGLPYGQWHTGPAVAAGVLAATAAGMVAMARQRGRALALWSVITLVLGTVIGLLQANAAGVVNAFNTRYILLAYPAVVAAAATGWVVARCRLAAALPVAAMWALAVLFFVVGFLPRFPFRVG